MCVQRARDQLFSCASFAEEQHRGIGRHHFVHLFQHRFQRRALANDSFEAESPRARLCEPRRFDFRDSRQPRDLRLTLPQRLRLVAAVQRAGKDLGQQAQARNQRRRPPAPWLGRFHRQRTHALACDQDRNQDR